MKLFKDGLKYLLNCMHLYANKVIGDLGRSIAKYALSKGREKPCKICCFQGFRLLTSNKARSKPLSTQMY